MIYNPLGQEIVRKIELPLYFTGLTEKAVITQENGAAETVRLARNYSATVTVRIPARGRTWLLVTSPAKD